MNNKFKKVLSYVGVGLVSAVFSVGALIGVSSCHANAIKEEKPIQAKPNIKSLVVPPSISASELNDYRFVNLYDYIRTNMSDLLPDGGTRYLYLTYNSEIFRLQSYSNEIVTFGTTSSPRKYINLEKNGVFTGYAESGFFNSSMTFNYAGSSGDTYIAEVKSAIAEDLNDRLLNVLGSFRFNSQINYNAPYDKVFDYICFQITNASTETVNTYFYENYFLSGGQEFNYMMFSYKSADDIYLDMGNGVASPFSGTGYFYFDALYYGNSYTGVSVQVNKRNVKLVDGHECIVKGSTWLSNNYRDIYLNIVDPTLNAYFNRLNNASNFAESFTDNTDVGISNVFSLLALAFSSLTSIFAIQIVPGITIGLMMFLPLIAGIIVLVIWIVKR